MKYTLSDNTMLLSLDRTQIIDITPGDVIGLEGFPGAEYTWTAQDSEFMENNPDDDIYLKLERIGENTYRANGILLRSAVAR